MVQERHNALCTGDDTLSELPYFKRRRKYRPPRRGNDSEEKPLEEVPDGEKERIRQTIRNKWRREAERTQQPPNECLEVLQTQFWVEDANNNEIIRKLTRHRHRLQEKHVVMLEEARRRKPRYSLSLHILSEFKRDMAESGSEG